jgi:hypothetical protein
MICDEASIIWHASADEASPQKASPDENLALRLVHNLPPATTGSVSLDDFLRARQHLRRNRDAEAPGSLQIDR